MMLINMMMMMGDEDQKLGDILPLLLMMQPGQDQNSMMPLMMMMTIQKDKKDDYKPCHVLWSKFYVNLEFIQLINYSCKTSL